MIIQRLVSVSQPLERVDDHVPRECNVQSSEPEVLALVHCHRLLDVESGVCVCESPCPLLVYMYEDVYTQKICYTI